MWNRPEPNLKPGVQPSPAEPRWAQSKVTEPQPTHRTMSVKSKVCLHKPLVSVEGIGRQHHHNDSNQKDTHTMMILVCFRANKRPNPSLCKWARASCQERDHSLIMILWGQPCQLNQEEAYFSDGSRKWMETRLCKPGLQRVRPRGNYLQTVP